MNYRHMADHKDSKDCSLSAAETKADSVCSTRAFPGVTLADFVVGSNTCLAPGADVRSVVSPLYLVVVMR